MKPDLHILVVNIDNLMFTKNCINDLMLQVDRDYELTVADNGSVEKGTGEYLKKLKDNGVNIVEYKNQRPLNWVWNKFYETNKNKYLCYLNNDTRLSNNYTKQTKEVLEKESSVGVVGHATNNPKYGKARPLDYVVLERKMRQGWDFTIRRKAYTLIPDELNTFCGDDYLYHNLYENGWKAAMILSSPIVHYLGKSGKSTTQAIYDGDRKAFFKMGYKDDISWSRYSVVKPKPPSKFRISSGYEPLITVCMVTYERYEEIAESIQMWLCQTEPRFILDVWQDGPDPRKRALVEGFNDERIRYSENPDRTNQYGHDMRNKSLMGCMTNYWCTTNDDNWPSPAYLETVLKEINGYDIFRGAVAMNNLPRKKKVPSMRPLITAGVDDVLPYSDNYTVLLSFADRHGDIDASQFAVDTKKAQGVGWSFMQFHGDFLFYEAMLKQGYSVRRLNKIIQVHR